MDTKEDTRAGIVMGIWEYVRINGLQDPDERRTINCDENLKKVTLFSEISPYILLANDRFLRWSRYSKQNDFTFLRYPSKHWHTSFRSSP